MQHPVNKLKGELSVFFALVLVIVASLLLNILEAARTQGARTYLTLSADSAIDSLFSQYHRKLWEDYRLLGLEMYSHREITDEYNGFIRPYVTEGRNWYDLSLPENNTEILSYELLTDSDGGVLRREILDYMKYGIAFSVMELADMLEFRDILKDGTACSEVSTEYSLCSEEAVEIEKILTGISRHISEHNSESDAAMTALMEYRGDDFLSSSQRLNALLTVIIQDVERFNAAADELSEAVSRANDDFETRYLSGELSTGSYETLKSEFSEYARYSEEKGEIRLKINELSELSEYNLTVLAETEEKTDEAMDYLAAFVPEEVIVGYLPPETEGGEPIPIYDYDEPDEGAAYAPAVSSFSSYKRMESPINAGTPDSEKEAQLNSVKALLSESMLSLILPEEYKTPGVPLELTDKPSEVFSVPETEVTDETVLSDRIFITEYILQLLNSYSEEGSTDRHLEAEYIIYGKETDSENLTGIIGETVAIRTGLNLIFLLKDAEKREMATQLSLAITGLASATPLSTVVFIMILTTWALAQAVLDVKDMLHGSRVPVMHTKESFYLSLEGLLSNFAEICSESHDSSGGLKYEDYLRLLLFVHMDSEREYRILDVIQMNLRKTQPDFLIERIYTGIQLETEAVSSHVFTGGNSDRYRIKVKTYYAY